MSERPLDRDIENARRAEGKPGSPPDAARWIGIAVAALLIVALVVLHLTGAIGPGAH